MDKLLTEEQVADFLGMHPKTLAKKRRDNSIALSFVQLPGRNIGYRPQDVERYLELHVVTRDGSGHTKHHNEARRKPKKTAATLGFMTDAEAQTFFEGIEKIDGVLECDPDSDPT
jgi:hypothetical protein